MPASIWRLVGTTPDKAISTVQGTGQDVQQAPSIAVDPTNAKHLVTAYLDYSLLTTGYAGIGIAVSTDGGKNWKNTSIPLPTGFSQGAAAPTVAFDAAGNLYVSFMAVTFLGPQPAVTNPDSTQRKAGFQSNNGIFVSEINTATLIADLQAGNTPTWNTATVVSHIYTNNTPVFFDTFPSMAIDTTGSAATNPNFGHLYVTWARFYPNGQFPGDSNAVGGSDVEIAVSKDQGASWQTQLQNVPGTGPGTGLVSAIQDPNDFNNEGGAGSGRGELGVSTVTVGAGGVVYVSTFTGGNFTVYSSQNGALSTTQITSHGPILVSSFSQPNFDGLPQQGSPFDFNYTLVEPDATLPNDSFRTLPTRQIVADPIHPGVLYAVASNVDASGRIDASGIVFAKSVDFGQGPGRAITRLAPNHRPSLR